MDELRAIFLACRPSNVHPESFCNVPVTYVSPAVPHLVIYASVCKAWSDSIARVVENRNMLDFRRLLVFSHQRHLVSHWIHGSSEDRFRVSGEVRSEVRLLVIKNPLQ